jgi:hypothetical protein
MEIEQRAIIKFFSDEGMKPLDIFMRFHKHYGIPASYGPTLYFWIGEARRCRRDVS